VEVKTAGVEVKAGEGRMELNSLEVRHHIGKIKRGLELFFQMRKCWSWLFLEEISRKSREEN
jgi:hypothetical protein